MKQVPECLSVALRGVGGTIEVSVIQSRGGIQVIQEKKLVGEKNTNI